MSPLKVYQQTMINYNLFEHGFIYFGSDYKVFKDCNDKSVMDHWKIAVHLHPTQNAKILRLDLFVEQDLLTRRDQIVNQCRLFQQ